MNVLTTLLWSLPALRRALCFARRFPPRLVALCLLMFILGAPQRAHARSSGWPSQSCGGCHNGGQVPTVSISADLANVNPGQVVNLTVSVSATNGHGAGFYLESSVGKLSIVDSGTKLLGYGVTHNARRTGTGNATTFKVAWTAPITPGGVDFYAWGNSVNSDNQASGDHDASGFLSFAFGCSGITYYHDYDGDGVGAVASGYTMACSLPPYYSARGDDCNDSVKSNFPGNPEICDGSDNNCNGQVDEALTDTTYCPDVDGDGHGVTGGATFTACAPKKGYGLCDNDCNDEDIDVFPGHPDLCDGKDNNCDGQTDELLPVATYCVDTDGDGHGIASGTPVTSCAKPAGYGACDADCDDKAASVYVGATELCDGKDNDCNNKVDENAILICGMGWCRQAAPGCSSTCTPGEPRAEVCNDFDDDCDGVNDNGSDLELCQQPGLHCAAGYCIPIEGEAGVGGEAGASEGSELAGRSGADNISGSGGDGNRGGRVERGGSPSTPSEPTSSKFACGFGRAPLPRPFGLAALLGLGLLLRRARRR